MRFSSKTHKELELVSFGEGSGKAGAFMGEVNQKVSCGLSFYGA